MPLTPMQKAGGYALPDPVTGYPLVDVCMKIPNDPIYINGFITHMQLLGKWLSWEKDFSAPGGDTRAVDAGLLWKDLIDQYLQISDGCGNVWTCEDIEPCLETSPLLTVVFNVLRQQQQFTFESVQNQWTIDYDGTPTSINPDAPTGTWDADGARRVALCMACQDYVHQWAASKYVVVQDNLAELMYRWYTGWGALSIVIPGLRATAELGVYQLTAILTALVDQAALSDVSCCMYNDLQGQAVTQSVFVASVDSCGFTPGTNEAIIADLLAADLDQSQYWAFLDADARAYTQTLLGVNNCQCETPPQSLPITIEFVPSDLGEYSIIPNSNVDTDISSGIGFVVSNVGDGDTYSAAGGETHWSTIPDIYSMVSVKIPVLDTDTITTITHTSKWIGQFVGGGNVFNSGWIILDTAGTVLASGGYSPAATRDVWTTKTVTGLSVTGAASVIVWLSRGYGTIYAPGDVVYMDRVSVS